MDGFLCVAKPAGWTSHDVVARVRRLLSTKRAGHAGTLDPDATGVLVVAVGRATRLLPHINLEPKIYRALCGFGRATSTEDAGGETMEEADASGLTRESLEAALPKFLGEIQQIPPMVSALHHNGQRLYDLARKGITVERAARTVTIHGLQLLDFAPGPRATAELTITCGGGTYIRTLCKDLGAAVGLPAHMARLSREAVGNFALAQAVSLEDVTEEKLISMPDALGWPTIEVSDAMAADLRLGRAVVYPPAPDNGEVPPIIGAGGNACLAALHAGALLALLRSEGEGRLQPFAVFAP